METREPDNFFLTFLYKLKGYCEEATFSINRSLDEKNFEMLKLVHHDSADSKSKVVLHKIQDAISSQSKIYFLNQSLNITKHLILNYQHIINFQSEFVEHFETLLWIFQKLSNSYINNQLQEAIEKIYGSSRLAQLLKFENIDIPRLEKESKAISGSLYVDDHNKSVNDLHLPWVNKKPAHHICFPQLKPKNERLAINLGPVQLKKESSVLKNMSILPPPLKNEKSIMSNSIIAPLQLKNEKSVIKNVSIAPPQLKSEKSIMSNSIIAPLQLRNEKSVIKNISPPRLKNDKSITNNGPFPPPSKPAEKPVFTFKRTRNLMAPATANLFKASWDPTKSQLPKLGTQSYKKEESKTDYNHQNLFKFGSKAFVEKTSTIMSIMFKQEDECLINSSANFDFHQVSSNLKISMIKGLCKTNIQFYDQIEPSLRSKGELFLDENFRPHMDSLTSGLTEFPIVENVVWKRITEIYQGMDLKICSDDIGPNDIQQGELGDCYLLSALSVLAEQKGFIRRLFHSKTPSVTGCYSIWLCDSGEWKNIILDDYIPCIESENRFEPCFSKSKSNDIWVVLLEKAFAKLFGNYHNIDGGVLSEAMTALTGAPTKYFKEKKNGISFTEQLWTFLNDSLRDNYPITAASRGESRLAQHKNMSIVSNHGYAVLDAREVSVSTPSAASTHEESNVSESLRKEEEEKEIKDSRLYEKIIKIRNPWGVISLSNSEEWSKKSQYWSTKVEIKEEQDEEGTFWITLDEFARNFKSICACEIHNDYYFSFIRMGEHTKDQNFFMARMDLQTSGFIYLTVQQKMKKHFRKNDSYQYSFARVILARVDENDNIISVPDGKYKNMQSITIRKKLSKGRYIIFVEVDWVQKIYNEVVITAYAKTKVNFVEEPSKKYEMFSLYESFLKALISSSDQMKFVKSKQYEDGDTKFKIWKHKVEKFGLVGLYYLNKEENVYLNTKIDVQKLHNMEVHCLGIKDNKTLEFRVDPGKERMVLFKSKIKDIIKDKDSDNEIIHNPSKGSTYEYGEFFRLENIFSDNEIKLLCLEKGKKIHSYLNGSIEVYTFKYLGGLADYYVNRAARGTFKQDIVFDAENILVNRQEPRNMTVYVHPQQEFLLNMKVKDLYKGSKFTRNRGKASLI